LLFCASIRDASYFIHASAFAAFAVFEAAPAFTVSLKERIMVGR
jgi:hypothetical protein